MTDEIPTEALQAAARAYDRATYGEVAAEHDEGLNAAIAAAAPYLIAEGRRQAAQAIRDTGPNAGWSLVHRETAAAIAEGDETPALMARYERELRAKIAAEIRAEAQREIDTQGSWFWFVHGEAGLESGGEWAARIAEGTDHG